MSRDRIAAAALVALGVVLGLVGAAWIGGAALVEARAPARVVTVRGLAEREVEADVAAWRIPFRGAAADQGEAIAAAGRAREAVRAFALGAGLAAEDLTDEPFIVKVERQFSEQTQTERLRFVAVGATRIRSRNVDAVEALTGRTLDLLQQGVLIGETDWADPPRALYVYTRLNDIKPAMIADATRSAREAAAQFAADSGARVGEIVTANQGVFQLLPRDGDYPEPQERRKIVRIVSTIDYRLAD